MTPEEAVQAAMDLYHDHPDYVGPAQACPHDYRTLDGRCIVCGRTRLQVCASLRGTRP